MKITVLGASGPTGQELVKALLANKAEVTAVVRRPGSAPNDTQEVIADVSDAHELGHAAQGSDAIMSCLGAPYSFKPISIYSDSTRALIEAMRDHRISRLITISAGMAHPIKEGGITWQRPVHSLLRNGPGRTLYLDMRRMENMLDGARDLDWTVMRPARLTDQATTEDELMITKKLPDGRGWTTRSDLARAMVREIQEPHIHATPFVTTR